MLPYIYPKKKILAKYRIQKSQGKIIPNQLKKSCNLHLATSNQYQTVILNFDWLKILHQYKTASLKLSGKVSTQSNNYFEIMFNIIKPNRQ